MKVQHNKPSNYTEGMPWSYHYCKRSNGLLLLYEFAYIWREDFLPDLISAGK